MRSTRFYAMLNEICEEPSLVQKLVNNRETITKPFVDLFCTNPIKRIYFTGSGSPLYVSNTLKYAAIKLLGVEATATPAMLFNHHDRFNTDVYKPNEMLLICPAESGMGHGQVDAARQAKKLGIPVVCTTWNLKGILGQESDIVLAKISPREEALATTKGQVMALLLVLMCFVDAAKALGHLNNEEHQAYLNALDHVPQNIQSAIDNTLAWFDKYQDVVMASPVYRIVGYGANVGTAEETALKFLECHKRPSLFYELEECLHGPIRSVRKDDVLFLLCAEDGAEKERMLKLYKIMKEYTDYCFLVQSDRDPVQDPKGISFKTDNVPFVNTMEYLVPMQVLAFKISESLGIDVSVSTTMAIKKNMITSYSMGE